MKEINSANNKHVKKWIKLKKRKYREKYKSYLVEGFHLVEEAIKHQKNKIVHLLISEDLRDEEEVQKILEQIPKDKLIILSATLADEISMTETTQGIFAEIVYPEEIKPKNIKGPFLLLDAVQDPGNVGTMIRTASAAGFEGVFLGNGTVDLYNDKTLRSAQGSHFQIDVYSGEIIEFIHFLKGHNFKVYATLLDKQAESYKNIKPSTSFGLIVGNEGQGVHQKLLKYVDKTVYIPMKGPVESLNVAIASSIIMFHLN